MRNRDLLSDIWWGVRNSATVMAIALVPAFLAWLLNPSAQLSSTSLSVGHVLVLYLAFAVAAGILGGIARPWLTTNVGAVIVGSIVGTIGFLGLTLLPGDAPPDPRFRPGMMVLGLFVGALLGWLIRRTVMRG